MSRKTLAILNYPHKALRTKAERIAAVDGGVRETAAEMIELMRKAQGVGLAAPQVGLAWRMFVAEVPPDEERSARGSPPSATEGPVVYINPEVVRMEGAPEAWEEGCLSLPEIRGDVLRPPVVTIRSQDLEGRTVETTATGLLARCWLHEIDHLDGVLIIDKMTQMSRLKNKAAVRDLERGV